MNTATLVLLLATWAVSMPACRRSPTGQDPLAAAPEAREPLFADGDEQFFFDDFEGYTATAQLLAWGAVQPGRWLSNAKSAIVLTEIGARSGRHAVRFTYAAGQPQQDRLLEAQPAGARRDVLITTFWIRTLRGYEWINASGNTHKIFLANIGEADRWGLMFGSEPLTPAMSAYGRLEELRPNLSIGLYNYNQNRNFNRMRVGRDVNDGAWHRITLRLTAASAPGAGRIEAWIDGILVIDYRGDTAGRPERGQVHIPAVLRAADFHFPSVMNAAPPRAQWIEYDDIRIWTR